MLVTEAMRVAKQRQLASTIILEVVRSNLSAVKTYENAGFQINPLLSTNEERWVMSRVVRPDVSRSDLN